MGGRELNTWASTVSSPHRRGSQCVHLRGSYFTQRPERRRLSGELWQLIRPSQGLAPFPGLFHESFVLRIAREGSIAAR